VRFLVDGAEVREPGGGMNGQKRVVLSATINPAYSFFAPLTALVWRHIAGFDPLLLLIGSSIEWRSDPRAAVVLAEASRHAEVVFVPRLAGVADHSLAQVVRLCAAALDGADDDYLLVSDIETWPLDGERYQAVDPRREFQVFNADAYGGDRLPMCYLGGRRAAWRDIFGLAGNIELALANIPWPADTDWHFDERYASGRLRAARDFERRCELLPRPCGPNHGRLDRARWRVPASRAGLVDAHLPRPGFTAEHWPQLRSLLQLLLPPDELDVSAAYHDRYIGASRIAVGDGGLESTFRLWFHEFARVAPEPYRSYGGYGDGEPNGTACSLEAIRAFARLVDDPDAVLLNAGAGASSFLLRRLFRNVVCVDGDATYLEIVRRICVDQGLSGEGFVVGLENAPEADYTFFDYGEISSQAAARDYALAYRKTRKAVYFDDADDRPHAFPRYRQLLLEFAASQGAPAEDCRAATDAYGRWGVVVRKVAPPPARGLIAFSLWGANPLYLHGAICNIEAAARYYPGFRVRIYTDDSDALDRAAACVTADPACDARRLAARHGVSIDVVTMPLNVGIRGMFWRFLAASDQQADPILIRDCDSRLNPREAAAVADWLASGRKFHVMHDHPHHVDWPMLGGMWGVRGGVLNDMERRIAAWGVWNTKPDDLKFLAERVWPDACHDLAHHSSVSTSSPAVSFPAHIPWTGFVGEIVPVAQ
jgi:hypothetical protein